MIRRRLRRGLWRERRGEAALEFALIGTVFVLLLLAPVEIGLMIWTGSSLQEVASETARCVAIDSSLCASNPQAYAVNLASRWISSSAISQSDVSVSLVSQCNSATGTFAKVTITTSIWSGTLMSQLGGTNQTAQACYPVV